MTIPTCTKHGVEMKLRPSGISKYGRFYPAFWACPEVTNGKWCKETRNAAEVAMKQQLGFEEEKPVTPSTSPGNDLPFAEKSYTNAAGEKLPWED